MAYSSTWDLVVKRLSDAMEAQSTLMGTQNSLIEAQNLLVAGGLPSGHGMTLHQYTAPTAADDATTHAIPIPGLRSHHVALVEISKAANTITEVNHGNMAAAIYSANDVLTLTWDESRDIDRAVVEVLVIDPGLFMPPGFLVGRGVAPGAGDATVYNINVPGLTADDILLPYCEVEGATGVDDLGIGDILKMEWAAGEIAKITTKGADNGHGGMVIGALCFRNYGDMIVATQQTIAGGGAVTSTVVQVPGMTTSHVAFLCPETDATATNFQKAIQKVVAGDGIVTITHTSMDPAAAVVNILGVKV